MTEVGKAIQEPQNPNGEIHETRGYCAALLNGETIHKESNDISDFSQLAMSASIMWIDFIVGDMDIEPMKIATTLGFSDVLVKSLMKNLRCGYEDLDNEMGILLPAIKVKGFEVKLDPLIILVRQNLLLTMHLSEITRFSRIRRYAETLLKKFPREMPQKNKLTGMLIRILDENNSRNFDYLREIEEQGDSMSQELSNPKTPREILSKQIYQMKHAIIIYLDGLWATVDSLNSLRYGDAALISDDTKQLNKLSGLLGETNAQIGLTEHLSDVLASGLEVLQSIYNNQLQVLNNRLAFVVAYLTIIGTALLVPNTIATVASNGMFGFTANDIPAYLGLIVVSTIVATIFSWWLVRKLGLLPKSPE